MIVDQSEDEISVINKTLGVSYSGARAFVSTAGGGFSLMSEGVSLAGMAEIPIVIVVGQRPGPATGLDWKGKDEQDSAVLAVDNAGTWGRWAFIEITDPWDAKNTIRATLQAETKKQGNKPCIG